MQAEDQNESLFNHQFYVALALTENLAPTAANIQRVSAQTTPEATRAAFSQWELRKRAEAKFTQAAQMLFVREALEQATGELAANYHAGLFPKDKVVADLTTGIGGDLIAFARRGPAVGFELDPVRCQLARANLKALQLEAEVKNEDGLEWLRGRNDAYVFADPARRVDGARVAAPEQYQPDPKLIAELGENQRLCVLKLSPLLSDPYLTSLAGRIEFLSVEGECKEVLAIVGREAVPGRFAVLAKANIRIQAEPAPPQTGQPNNYLYDCDPALVRAHAYGALCNRYDLQPLADSHGYLTGEKQIHDPWLRTYQVLYEGPGDLKRTKQALQELNSSTPILKQRLTGLDLQKTRKALQMKGDRELAVVCYPQAKHVRHAIVLPLP